MRFDPSKFLKVFFRNTGALAPVLVVAAMVSVVFAADAARGFAAQLAAQTTEVRHHGVTLRREPLTPEQALRAAQQLSRLVPGVRVQVAGSDVVIAVQHKEHIAEWMYALGAVQGTLPQLAWETRHLCLVTCGGGDAARAYVTAFRPRLVASQ